jgi:hypothetical protein
MPGRRRTGSKPLNTSMSEAVYDDAIHFLKVEGGGV